MTETFEKWAERMETEFNAKRTSVGLKKWFEKFNTKDEGFRTLFKAFTEKKRVGGQIKDFDRNFLGTMIAMSFYPSEYNEKRFMTQSGRSTGETRIFDERGNWGTFLNKVWEGICLNEQGTGSENSFSDRLGKPSEKTLSVEDNSKGDLHWIELCSALQKKCNVFDSLLTLNKFITTAFRVDHPNDLSDYGLYVRNIDDLCIAYGILNGKSFAEIRKLIIECRGIVKDKQKVVSPYAAEETITKELEGNFADLIGMDKGFFLSRIKGFADRFLPENSDNHWSLFKDVLKDIYKKVAEINGQNSKLIDEEIDSFFEDEDETRETKNFVKRIEILKNEFNKIIKIDVGKLKEHDTDSLFSCIIQRLLIKEKDEALLGMFDDLKTTTAYETKGRGYLYTKTIDYEQEEQLKKEEKEVPSMLAVNFDLPISNLRSIYIVTLLKHIYKFGSLDEVEFVIEDINYELEKCNLRVIDYKVSSTKFDNTSTDIFDWFIVECVIRDKENHSKDGYYISGFELFCEFMGFENNIGENDDA